MRVPSSGNILEVLRALGNYGTLILALQVRRHCCCCRYCCQCCLVLVGVDVTVF
jgi:hypothetical protein